MTCIKTTNFGFSDNCLHDCFDINIGPMNRPVFESPKNALSSDVYIVRPELREYEAI